jgi:hypothetical protein
LLKNRSNLNYPGWNMNAIPAVANPVIPNPKDLVWNDTPEVFELFRNAYDIAAAKQILRAKKKLQVGTVEVSQVQQWIGEPGKLTLGIGIDWDKLEKEWDSLDLSFPIIVATIKVGQLFPIDGWHRLAKAKRAGIQTLPAVCLNRRDTCKIQL